MNCGYCDQELVNGELDQWQCMECGIPVCESCCGEDDGLRVLCVECSGGES